MLLSTCDPELRNYIHSFSNVEDKSLHWEKVLKCDLHTIGTALLTVYNEDVSLTFISVLLLVAWLVNVQVATAYELP